MAACTLQTVQLWASLPGLAERAKKLVKPRTGKPLRPRFAHAGERVFPANRLTLGCACDMLKNSGISRRHMGGTSDMHPQKRITQAKQTSASPEDLPYWNGRLSHPIYSRVVKRLLDLLLALALLPFGLIVMLPITAAVKCTSRGPVFYRALRGGYHNKPFTILKFRTMVVGADQYSGTTALNDPRVTRVGRVLRRTKLDEIPQLFNILRGDMSFIGPRPELLKYTTRYTPEQQCILWVRPGISDPSSIQLISLDEAVGHDDPEGAYERNILGKKNRMRVQYATTQSFGTDMRLLALTVACVTRKILSRSGSQR